MRKVGSLQPAFLSFSFSLSLCIPTFLYFFMASLDIEAKPTRQENNEENNIDYSQRAQWLRAAVLGATDGLVSVTSLMLGVGAVNEDIKIIKFNFLSLNT